MIDGHGDDSYKYSRPITANFSSNVYSKVNLSRLKAHLCECIGEIGNYPEPEPYTLEARIASRCQLPSGAVCVTNGATEAIYLIAQTFRGTNTAILQPTFSEYADACRMHGHRVSSLYQLPKEQDGYRLPDDVRMLWLCNPNNPTGTVADKEYMRGLIEHNPQVCFIIVLYAVSAFLSGRGGGVSECTAAAFHDEKVCDSRFAAWICNGQLRFAGAAAHQPYAVVGQPACH